MITSRAFDQLMQPLLRYLNVSAPMLSENQGINIDFEYASIRFTPLSRDELLIVASLGCLPAEYDNGLAWRLLSQNSFDQPAPAITLSVQGDEKTVLLWSRERFVNLDGNTLITLFERLVDQINETIRVISLR
ncbi:CesT family type III secretion system chaperone [[Erwinia] mediterraneensis]|uniref:CesT family type III secretion system chaperone n=1 Tax=[Erwinia] mediterraneensis TaxID=2161819 RepID=UPI0010311A1E|nr:CesT family type III secretion system chaperone [[Erwinia] mediterraneensis]